MSYVVHANNENEKNRFTEYADDVESQQKHGIQESDDARWQQEIEYRKVKDTTDLQMLKNQKRRSDLNMRLSKQILGNGSQY
jgi:hypothetical protein